MLSTTVRHVEKATDIQQLPWPFAVYKETPTGARAEKKNVISEKWLQDVQWLEANDGCTEMWCKICRSNPHLADKTGPF